MDATLIDGYWLPSYRSDPRVIALYSRHYSAKKNHRPGRHLKNCVGPGEPMVLLTADCTAAFCWLSNSIERWDKQTGICCTLFRNEGPVLSSALIREAVDLAWQRWPGQRLFTYVDPSAVRRKRDPGRCFRKAGWQLVRDETGKPVTSTRGLLIFECLPETTQPSTPPRSDPAIEAAGSLTPTEVTQRERQTPPTVPWRPGSCVRAAGPLRPAMHKKRPASAAN